MRLLLFCENANHVHLCNNILSSEALPQSVQASFLMLDWDRETSAWVMGTVNALGVALPTDNMYEHAPAVLQKHVLAAKTAKDRKAVLQDIAFEYLRQYFQKRDLILAQFNDASLRGNAVANVCKNIGLSRLLLQDGFLNFVSKTDRLSETDQNYKWGATQPEHAAVWGEAMKTALLSRHNSNPETIQITGPLKSDVIVPRRVDRTAVAKERGPKILWADQAILDQRKADETAWLEEFRDIAQELSPFNVDLRLHPSTKEHTRKKLEAAVNGRLPVELTASSALSDEELKNYDVVVTYYSTVFLNCLAQNVPCVIFKTKSIDIELPEINHPLLSYCTDLADLAETVRTADQSSYTGNTPEDIFHYTADHDGVKSIVSLLTKLSQSFDSLETQRSTPDFKNIEVQTNLRRLLGRRLLIIGGSFGDHIGVGKPIKVFLDYVDSLGLDVDLHLATSGSRDYLLKKISEADMVIINSFDVVRILKESDLRDLEKICEMKGTPLIFYCHETEFVFRKLLNEAGGKMNSFLKNVLPKAHVLTVSDRQADWLGSLGVKSVRTIYNSVGPNFQPVERQLTEDRPLIVMVGTQQRRKGVELFSRVADLSKRHDLDWRFVWLGAYTKAANGCYRSEAVEWKGHVSAPEVRQWLGSASAFFLSSIDDPLPLSVGEALMSGVPCVVYLHTGFSDFIALHRAGEVYNLYDPQVAFERLSALVERPETYTINADSVRELVGVDAFGKRMLVSLGEIIASDGAEYMVNKQLPGPVALHRVNVKHSSANAPKTASPAAKKAEPSLKMRTLNALDRNLPNFITKPGERILRRIGIL